MSSCLYFLPGCDEQITAEKARTVGLGYLLDHAGAIGPGGREPLIGRGVPGAGPDGHPGLVVAVAGTVSGEHLGYHAKRQQWMRCPGTDEGRPWIGVYKPDDPAGRPTPLELQRENMLGGHLVRLADGRDWLAPIARKLIVKGAEITGHLSALPGGVACDEAGNWSVGPAVNGYARLWEVAQAFWDQFMDAEEDGEEVVSDQSSGVSKRVTFDFADLADGALLALATNYRVSKAEVTALGLFDSQCLQQVLMALIDWPALQEVLKKKVAVGTSSSTPGPGVETPTTAPA